MIFRRRILGGRLLLFLGGLGTALLLHAGPSSPLPPAVLSDPVQDAKDAFAGKETEFVSIQLADTVELPGLKEKQIDMVSKNYQVRSLNRRWQTFANIEDDPRRLLQMRRYATRYNLMMWRLIQQDQRQEKTRYRY